MGDLDLVREARGLKNDKIMTNRLLDEEQQTMKNSLMGDLGKDMDDVLSGRVKVKLSWKEKIKYKVNFWLNKFFKTF